MEREAQAPPATAAARLRDDQAALVWSPAARGVLCHRLIATLCANRTWTLSAIEAAAHALVPARTAPTHSAALVGFLVPAAASYHRHFERNGWRFAGSEVVVGEVALDLLWRRGSRLEADEVKSGADTGPGWLDRANAQAAAQCAEGRRLLGDAFAGVRVAPVLDPSAAIWVPA